MYWVIYDILGFMIVVDEGVSSGYELFFFVGVK